MPKKRKKTKKRKKRRGKKREKQEGNGEKERANFNHGSPHGSSLQQNMGGRRRRKKLK